MTWIKTIRKDFVSLFHFTPGKSIIARLNNSFFENDYAVIMVKLKNMADEIFNG